MNATKKRIYYAIVLLPISACVVAAFATTNPLPRTKQQGRRSNWRTTLSAQPSLIRGERYSEANSTLPSPALVAERLNVKPALETSPKNWKRAWRFHKRMLPILHSTDGCKPPDSKLNLACMWWKALGGLDKSSPVYDERLSYDLLPSVWRKVLRLRRLYPRLHHSNVELRTAYLDNAVSEIVDKVNQKGDTKIRLVCMGAGYDSRGMKMLERKKVDVVIELDLPGVVDAKKRLFERLVSRRPWLSDLKRPTLVPSDFNDVLDVEKKLADILTVNDAENWHTIFVFEAVMIYLDDGVPSALLNATSNALSARELNGSLCFADRLENVPGGDHDLGVQELESNGWNILDWCPKPGLARHMGAAELLI